MAPELSGWRKVSATGKQVATSSKRAASKAKKLGAKGVSKAKRAVEDLGALVESSAPATDDKCGFNLKVGESQRWDHCRLNFYHQQTTSKQDFDCDY